MIDIHIFPNMIKTKKTKLIVLLINFEIFKMFAIIVSAVTK